MTDRLCVASDDLEWPVTAFEGHGILTNRTSQKLTDNVTIEH